MNIVMAATFREYQQQAALRLSSPELSVVENTCLTFRYKKTWRVVFWVATVPATRLNEDFDRSGFIWRSAAIQLPLGSYKIVFGAYATKGVVYLDDVRVVQGACPIDDDGKPHIFQGWF